MMLTGELDNAEDDFRTDITYRLSNFGNVEELELPRAAAKYLR